MSGISRPGGVLAFRGPQEDIVAQIQNFGAALNRNNGTQDNPVRLSTEPRAEQIRDAVQSMEQMFPDFCPKAATKLLKDFCSDSKPFELALDHTLDYFLKFGFGNPRDVGGASTSNAPAAAKAENGRQHHTDKELVELTSSDSDESDHTPEELPDAELYEEWCMYCLSRDFPRVGLPSLKKALELFRGKLDPTYKAVMLQYERATKKKGAGSRDVGIVADQGLEDVSWLPKGRLKLLKAERVRRLEPLTECPRFESDWNALQSEFRNSEESDDGGSNAEGGEPAPPPAGIECGCCYAENLFEDLVQCADGHLFCKDCLRRHLEGYIFGGSQACGLPLCLDTNGCDKTFPWSEVKKVLPLDVLSKYEQRQAEDAVARAQLEGLVYCPFCNHPWEVDRGMAVLRCHNEVCKKASCIKCKEPDHLPQRCEEVESKSETSIRRKVEEKMTRALIRECTSCRAELVKLEGCNKVTCRCGQHMCYVCRIPIRDYSHFCQHARQPGQPCRDCSACNLWEKENEDAVVEAAKKAAIEEVGAQDLDLLKRDIGPSEAEKPFKKPRLGPFPLY